MHPLGVVQHNERFRHWLPFDKPARDLMKHAKVEYNLRARVYDPILKVAWTIAGLTCSQ